MKVSLRLVLPATLALAAVVAGATQVSARGAARAVPPRPNIVVIMTDDQTLESVRVMRRVRGLLMRQGTTFTNAFVSFPLCCPSRATFLTGQYSHNTGVVGNSFLNGYSRFDQSNTLPVWLKRAGYSTILVGKYLNEYGKVARRGFVPPGWDDWHAAIRVNYYGHSLVDRRGRITYYGTRTRDYATDVYARVALQAIQRHAPSPRPFFMWLSFFAPHDGTPLETDDPPGVLTPAPARRHRNRFAGLNLPAWPSLNERDVSDKPFEVRRRPLLTATQLAALREKYQQRLESLLAVDEAVGRIVAELRRQRELERTVIIFTSDNGFIEGQHRVFSGKELAYEPSVRVPLIMRGPRVPRRLRLSQMVVNADLAPTIVRLARARADLEPDGRSLLPLLSDPRRQWGRDLLFERGPGSNVDGPRRYTGIRTPRYVFVEHLTGERELYDLTVDRDQLRNLYGDPAYASIETELARRLVLLRECVAAFCRAGPAVRFSLALAGACAVSPRHARIAGADERLLRYVEFVVNGRRSRDAQAPFERVVPAASAPSGAKLRALAVFADGRRVTLERTVRC